MLTQDDLKQFAGTNRYYRHWLRRFVRPRLTIQNAVGTRCLFAHCLLLSSLLNISSLHVHRRNRLHPLPFHFDVFKSSHF